ncbi:MAG: helix-turn-helix domain-containing protein [Rhodoferax sp.]|nr:helix-turn-helix domain-containing protein [Rhodoferax sp.]MDP3653428.1 helix-turn-helix domain-containing protein [Rhodoferax sp.]
MHVPTHAALIAPRLSLASCVRTYVTRSTLGAELRVEQRYNHFPAGAFCSMTWLLQGESTIIRRGDESIHEPLPKLAFAGPQTLPSVSVNPGPVSSFMVILIPAAVRALADVDLAALVNRVVPMETVLGAAWQALGQAVAQAPDDATRVQLVEAFLEPRWSAVRQEAMPAADRQRYWVEGLALRAATSGVGQSLRQVERRIKQWAGLPLRDLRRLARSEESFIQARTAVESSTPNWSDIAADGGYADQAHLCRDTRRVTGLSPTELKKAVLEDEGFWLYRLWV